jgi:predicted dehydrogenase
MDEHDVITVVSDKIEGAPGAGSFQIQTRPQVGAPSLPAEGMAGAIEHLLDCLETGAQPLTHGEDARASLELVEAAYRSIAEKSAIRLPLQPAAVATGAGVAQ